MNTAAITQPSPEMLAEMVEVRVASAVEAYSRPEGPSKDEVRRRYQADSEAIISLVKGGKMQARVVQLGEGVVSMCVWSSEGPSSKLQYLYTHPDHQGFGYGSMLLDCLITELDGSAIELTTQSAQRFYEKWGFQARGTFVDDGITVEEVMVRPAMLDQ